MAFMVERFRSGFSVCMHRQAYYSSTPFFTGGMRMSLNVKARTKQSSWG
jgi:hypothetical protein